MTTTKTKTTTKTATPAVATTGRKVPARASGKVVIREACAVASCVNPPVEASSFCTDHAPLAHPEIAAELGAAFARAAQKKEAELAKTKRPAKTCATPGCSEAPARGGKGHCAPHVAEIAAAEAKLALLDKKLALDAAKAEAWAKLQAEAAKAAAPEAARNDPYELAKVLAAPAPAPEGDIRSLTSDPQSARKLAAAFKKRAAKASVLAVVEANAAPTLPTPAPAAPVAEAEAPALRELASTAASVIRELRERGWADSKIGEAVGIPATKPHTRAHVVWGWRMQKGSSPSAEQLAALKALLPLEPQSSRGGVRKAKTPAAAAKLVVLPTAPSPDQRQLMLELYAALGRVLAANS